MRGGGGGRGGGRAPEHCAVIRPVSKRIRSPRKSDTGRIRYASGFDPTSADSIRGINGAVRLILSTSHSERCYISQYSCGSDLANLGYESTNTIFVRVFLDSGSELTSNVTNIYVKIKLQHNVLKMLQNHTSSQQLVIFLDRRLATKTDRFRGEGSNPLVKLIRGGSDLLVKMIRRIDFASGSDPPGSV